MGNETVIKNAEEKNKNEEFKKNEEDLKASLDLSNL